MNSCSKAELKSSSTSWTSKFIIFSSCMGRLHCLVLSFLVFQHFHVVYQFPVLDSCNRLRCSLEVYLNFLQNPSLTESPSHYGGCIFGYCLPAYLYCLFLSIRFVCYKHFAPWGIQNLCDQRNKFSTLEASTHIELLVVLHLIYNFIRQ